MSPSRARPLKGLLLVALEGALRPTGFEGPPPGYFSLGGGGKILYPYRADPVYLWALKPHLRLAVASASRVLTNAPGLRGGEVRSVPAAGTKRVLCLGDSVTAGGLYASWPLELERWLREDVRAAPVEVVNADVPAYSSFQALRFYEDALADLRAADVVVMVGFNDRADARPGSDARLAVRGRTAAALRRALDGLAAVQLLRAAVRSASPRREDPPTPGPASPSPSTARISPRSSTSRERAGRPRCGSRSPGSQEGVRTRLPPLTSPTPRRCGRSPRRGAFSSSTSRGSGAKRRASSSSTRSGSLRSRGRATSTGSTPTTSEGGRWRRGLAAASSPPGCSRARRPPLSPRARGPTSPWRSQISTGSPATRSRRRSTTGPASTCGGSRSSATRWASGASIRPRRRARSPRPSSPSPAAASRWRSAGIAGASSCSGRTAPPSIRRLVPSPSRPSSGSAPANPPSS